MNQYTVGADFKHIIKHKESKHYVWLEQLKKHKWVNYAKNSKGVSAAVVALSLGLTSVVLTSNENSSPAVEEITIGSIELDKSINTSPLQTNLDPFVFKMPSVIAKQDMCSAEEGCLPPKLITSLKHPELGRFYEKDVQCMAKNIYFESMNQDEVGMLATAEVTLSRMKDWRFPKQLCSVVYEKNKVNRKGRDVTIFQFSWVGEGNKQIDYESHAWSESVRLAREMLSGRKSNLTKGALFYHAYYVQPDWAKDKRVKKVAVVKDHHYYDFIVDGITLTTPLSEVRKIIKEKGLNIKI